MLSPVKGVLKAAECSLVFLSIVLLAVVVAELARASVFQIAERRKFAASIKAESGVALPARPAIGSAIGDLEIPRIALSSVIVEGDGDQQLQSAAGHIPGTPFPGQSGNSAIAGHRDTFFRALRLIRKNDSISVTTRRGEFTYRVTATRIVQPEDVQVLSATTSETLTLVTCYPFYFVGPAPSRFIVQAERVSLPAEK